MSELSEHQKLVLEKINRSEARAENSLALIREAIRDFLMNSKGYHDEDIEVDREFEIVLNNEKTATSVDYIVKVNGRDIMAIKCSPGALESRERHLISFARVVEPYQIPFAVVTDGSRSRVLDAISGKLVSEDLDFLPERARAAEMLDSMKPATCPAERLEREKRILLAFDSIRCTEEGGG